MGTVLIEKTAGVEMLHIPYGGISAVVSAMRSETIDIALITPPTVKPHTDAGAMRPIVSTGKERHPLFPDIPTLEESGFPGLTVVVWQGLRAMERRGESREHRRHRVITASAAIRQTR